MFTGIIQEIGTVSAIQKTNSGIKLSIIAKKLTSKLQKGDSLAINGVCLTVISKKKNQLSLDVIQETLSRTNLGSLKQDSQINLELPLTLTGFLSGHLVQGHIDGTGTIKKLKLMNEGYEIDIAFPKKLKKYIALKGSITVNGISLTIAKLSKKSFSVALTRFTWQETTFKNFQKNEEVNLEVDIVARYLENLSHSAKQSGH